ncbi:ornithine decarboxylase-like isoform X1 [Argiope bruennichi]|uniref:ornithine decarboxylase n=2 Tax=Argiope bruennichi TaxID=94029 RepID=A0A8T0F850_ARGBR|nr:ornithine decarboxylase-like isoform X1 [Argiope bruennichi]KAF8787376.1 Ornithine decarboxylase like protein [Argiope bruennichi]
MSVNLNETTWHPRRERKMSEARNQAIVDVIKNCIVKKNNDIPFYVADFSDVLYKCRYWKTKLPRVEPFYAVKCNPDPMLLSLLVSLGIRFDCASKGEIDAVLAAGAESSDIIYAHPFKSNTFLRYAASVNVDLMTFDCEQELYKIKKIFPQARLVLRISIPNVPAAFPLSNKFGCTVKEAQKLLVVAQNLDLNVVGVSFHVGSLCEQPFAYAKAVKMAREVFDMAEDIGYHFTLLDLGGGFPGSTGSMDIFDKMCYYITEALDQHFPEGCGIRVIAEPGCYIACSAYTLCCKVIGKKTADMNPEDEGSYKQQVFYYLNDGAYGSFGYGFEKYGFRIKPLLSKSQHASRPILRSKLWGATCCSSDCIVEDCLLPEMEVGEYIIFDNMGAYTRSLVTGFNGFPMPMTHYVFPPQSVHKTDLLPPFEDYCKELGTNKMKAFVKIQDYIMHDDSNDDLFRKG